MKKLTILLLLLITSSLYAAPKYGTFTDERDGQTYKTIDIDGYTWLAENLNYDTGVTANKILSYTYADTKENGEKFGRLYEIRAVKAAIPKGWHLPSEEEWDALIEAAGGEDIAGYNLKSKSSWKGDGNGCDKLGFNALGAGYRYLTDSYEIGERASWWSADINGEPAFRRKMGSDYNFVYHNGYRPFKAYSIRVVKDYPQDTTKFIGTVESLRRYKCPEWFRDAKFGIYTMFGVFSVPEHDDWYARYMYQEGSYTYDHHVKTYGHPSEFGYKDLIPLWKAENFHPNELMKLFKQAGAKYYAACAIHHDNFDIWNSKYHKWNAVEMGPKKDILGMFKAAADKEGLRFGVTTHLARSYEWMNTANNCDKSGKYKGVPYDALAGEGEGFYPPNDGHGTNLFSANPPKWWRESWYNRLSQLIEDYDPDIMYYDGAIPFLNDNGAVGMKLMAHYYNERPEGFMTYKIRKSGVIHKGVSSIGHERTGCNEIMDDPWQTDDSIGPWVYTKGGSYAEPDLVVDKVIDIVSKNGNMLLCVPLRADGSIDAEERSILENIGKWFDINGEAIYGTRPWEKFGEGETSIQSFEKRSPMTSKDIRFTKKGDTLYAFVLNWPENGSEVVIKSLAKDLFDSSQIKNVELLGSKESIKWNQTSSGMNFMFPAKKTGMYAHVLKIKLK